MELRSSCQVAEWFHAAQKNVTEYELKTETDLLKSVSVSLQHQISFFILEKGYYSKISSKEMIHFFTFLYFVWKALILFGYSYLHEMKHKESRLSLMQADYHLSNAATSFGTISNASSLKDELEEVLTGISVGLKKQKSRIGKSHLLIPDWEEFQKGRFQSIQNFYTTSLRKLYMLTIPVEDKRDHLFTLSTAFAGDLFYTNGKSENSYYSQIEKTTPWEVTYVKPYYNGSEISLPIHSKKNAGGDF